MKKIFISLLFLSATSYANSVICKVNDSTLPSAVSIQLDGNKLGVASIDYQFQFKTSDGNLNEKVVRIYSRWPLIRGELTSDYCSENENEYLDFNETYSLWSMCAAPQGMVGKIAFLAGFSIKNGGKISYVKADGVTPQDLSFSTCD